MSSGDRSSFNSSQLSDNVMMSEQEAQTIVQGYNLTIQSLVKENDILQDKWEEMQKNEAEELQKLDQAKKKYQQEHSRMTHLKTRQFEIDQQRQQLLKNPLFDQNSDVIGQINAFLKNNMQSVQSMGSLTQIESTNLIQFDPPELKVPKSLQEISQTQTNLNDKKQDQVNKILNSIYKYSQIQLQKCQKKECQQCHQQYNPRTNNIVNFEIIKNSCLFHSGKMKFYSCMKCGSDDYYTCCNKCRRCSEGCKTNFHQPKP